MDTTRVPQPRRHDQAKPEELISAACAAMRLLQDRQMHTPEEMLDHRERRVLSQLRKAIRHTTIKRAL